MTLEPIDVKPIEAELAQLQHEAQQIKGEMNRHSLLLVALREQHQRLIGTPYSLGDGEIPAKNRELLKAQRHNVDLNLPRVVWMSKREKSTEYVVDKRTAKRIFIRRIGGNTCLQFTLDGRRLYQGAEVQINVEATFSATATS